jgi:FkbH-like protein
MRDGQRIELVATFTIEPIVPMLHAWGELFGVSLELAVAPFGQLYQTLLGDEGSGRTSCYLVRLEDLAGGDVAAAARELGETLRARASAAPAERLLIVCPASRKVRENPAENEAFRGAERALLALVAGAPGVGVVGSAALVRGLDEDAIDDAHRERLAAVPYRPEVFAALAREVARHVALGHEAPRKVLVLDADETLWGGVVGEDGPAGLRLGEGRRALHTLALAWRREGALLALASKNEEADLRRAFADRADFPLRFEDFSAHRVGWGSKVESLAAIAGELGLGLGSFVFLDDSPLEIAAVREALPEVLALQLPREDEAIGRFVQQIWPLERRALTEEDRGRAAAYVDERARQGARERAPSLAAFVESLALEVHIEPLSEVDVPRAAQLSQRTNQLATTLRRWTEAEVARLGAEGIDAALVRARDRFGDYGKVGLFALRARGEALVVDAFALSCRALGRGIEERMIAAIGERALARGLAQVELPFVPGPRNAPARALLGRVAGEPREERAGALIFALAATSAARVRYAPSEAPRPSSEQPSGATREAGRDARSTLWQAIAEGLHEPRAFLARMEEARRASPAREPDGAPPRGAVEEVVAAIFAAVLGLGRVGAEEGFFALGGHSLAMTELLSRVRDSFFVELPLGAMLAEPTVRGVARAVEDASGVEAAHALADLVKRVNQLAESEVEALLGEEGASADRDARRPEGVEELRAPAERTERRATIAWTGSGPVQDALLPHKIAEILALRGAEEGVARGTIELLAIPTCDRPEALLRCVTSHLASAERAGRRLSIVVGDDSRSIDLAARTREALRGFPSVRVADRRRKRAYASTLAAHAGVDPALVDFALFDPEEAGHPTGANLNALLLDGAGSLVFRADDDTLGGASELPSRRSGLAIVAGDDPAELWSFDDRASCFAALRFEDELDVLGEHERILGRDPRSIAREHGGELHVGQVDEAFVARLARGSSRVRVSFTGLAGDCGWGAPFGFWGVPLGHLLLEGESLARLTREPALYRAKLTRRELVRSTTRTTIADATFGMTTFVGLDLRGLVPPYLPVRRGQDVLWVQMLERCFDDALFGQTPHVLRHEPAELRRFAEGELFRSATGLDLARIMVALVRAAALSDVESGAPRLRALGDHLAGIGALDPGGFDRALREALWREHERLVGWAERALLRNPGAPPFWRADVHRYVEEAAHFLGSAPRLCPLDLVRGERNFAGAAVLAQRLVLRFGQLCACWPALYDAAIELKSRGASLGAPLASKGARGEDGP